MLNAIALRTLLLPLLLAVLALSGCASAPHPVPAPPSVSPAPPPDVVRRLMAQHDEWAGTPYRLGGNSRRGIDCSAFVQTTYAERFGHRLPRSTEDQARHGQPVRRDQLQAGDLVFFRTGRKTRHVGIYMGDSRFLHASTSQGVTVSRLDNPYWTSAYWMSRRP
ncbi:C40 family peptidase [Ectothiorhodospiraceae bacterium 2226]|nr:C40 family peptidase [Ectothiorhodospiraceae bacterium 2226]